MGINYYKEKDQIAVLIQGKMSEVRPRNSKGDFYDTILLLLDGGGDI